MKLYSKTTILLLATSLWSVGCMSNLNDDEDIFKELPVTQEPYRPYHPWAADKYATPRSGHPSTKNRYDSSTNAWADVDNRYTSSQNNQPGSATGYDSSESEDSEDFLSSWLREREQREQERQQRERQQREQERQQRERQQRERERQQRERQQRERERPQRVRAVALAAVYEVFELNGNGDIDVNALKRARRSMMRTWHPDRNAHAKSVEVAQVLNELWEKLEERYINDIHGAHGNAYWEEIREICEKYQSIID